MNNYDAIYDYGARQYPSWTNAAYKQLANKFKAKRNLLITELAFLPPPLSLSLSLSIYLSIYLSILLDIKVYKIVVFR